MKLRKIVHGEVSVNQGKKLEKYGHLELLREMLGTLEDFL